MDLKIKKGIEKKQIQEVLDYTYTFFSHLMNKMSFEQYIRDLANVDWESSALLIDNNGKMLGAYILGNHQLRSMIYDDKFDKLRGFEGVLLCVDESIRGKGWGNKLKDYPKTLGLDYIWGQQFKDLNNLNDWLKRRVLVGETSNVYITAEIF